MGSLLIGTHILAFFGISLPIVQVGGGLVLPAAGLVGCALIGISIYIAYRFSEPIGRALGDTAMNIIVRLSSFILLCVGVQIVWNGATKLLSSIS